MGCEQNCFNEHRLEELEKVVHEMKEKHSKRDGIFLNVSMRLKPKLFFTTMISGTSKIRWMK